jgi:hypothetical protein
MDGNTRRTDGMNKISATKDVDGSFGRKSFHKLGLPVNSVSSRYDSRTPTAHELAALRYKQIESKRA